MKRSLPVLAQLHTFEVAARLQSFALAAQALNLTASAVSHQIKDLEGYFSRALFERTHRRVRLTYEGKRLYESLGRVFDALQAACAEVALPPADQVVAVHCAPSLAIKWLSPHLPAFFSAHPQINVRLTTGAPVLDLGAVTEIDVLLSYGSAPPARAGVLSESLGEERIAPLAAPSLLPKRMRASQSLQKLTLIDSTLTPITWPQWFAHQGLPAPQRPRPAFDRAALAIAAAADGLGVALESTRLAARELARGDLVEIRAKNLKPLLRAMHFLSVRRSDLVRPGVRVFVDWVRAQALR